MRGLPAPAAPTAEERLRTARAQIALACERKGEHIAVLEARKHLAWYLKGVRQSAAYRARFAEVKTAAEMDALIEEFLERRPDLDYGA